MTVPAHGTPNVKDIYERHPYPLPKPASEPLFDVSMALSLLVGDLSGLRVLDVGCGTGHRLVGMAEQHPDTTFVGLDFSEASLALASQLIHEHQLTNVSVVQAEVGGEGLGTSFDMATCTGVLHHLPNPREGVAWIRGHLEPEGLLYAWHYHRYGEHTRLLNRQLVQLLRAERESAALEAVRELGISVSLSQYGTPGIADDPRVQAAADADAFLNPIVNAYTFDEARDLLSGSFESTLEFGLTMPGASWILDDLLTMLTRPGSAEMPQPLQPIGPTTLGLMRHRSRADQARFVELLMKPTGFSTASWNGQSRIADCG